MKKFYYVGGPKLEQSEEFSRCPSLAGKKPAAWCIAPRIPNDSKKSGAAKFEPQGVAWNRLLHLNSASEWSQIVMISDRVQ